MEEQGGYGRRHYRAFFCSPSYVCELPKKKKPFNPHCHLPDRDNGAGLAGSWRSNVKYEFCTLRGVLAEHRSPEHFLSLLILLFVSRVILRVVWPW